MQPAAILLLAAVLPAPAPAVHPANPGHRQDLALSPAGSCSGPLRGCVTGVTAEGFFLQDPAGDGDPATSDGIYVYRYSTWRNPRGLKPGDLVEITAIR